MSGPRGAQRDAAVDGSLRTLDSVPRAHESTLAGLVAVVMVAACDIVRRAAAACSTPIQVNSASSKVAQAKELGAEKLAPYEYYYANEHLTKGDVEAAEGDYSDANRLRRGRRGVRRQGDQALEGGAPRGGAMSDASLSGVGGASRSSRCSALRAAARAPVMRGQDRRARQDRQAGRAQRRDPLRAARARASPSRTSSSPRSSSIRASSRKREAITSPSPSPTRTPPTISRRPRSAPSAAS